MSMTVDEMAELLLRHDERSKTTGEKVDALHHVLLEGNGSPALTVQVATLRADVDNIKRSKGDRVAIWAALITGGIGFIEMLVRHIL